LAPLCDKKYTYYQNKCTYFLHYLECCHVTINVNHVSPVPLGVQSGNVANEQCASTGHCCAPCCCCYCTHSNVLRPFYLCCDCSIWNNFALNGKERLKWSSTVPLLSSLAHFLVKFLCWQWVTVISLDTCQRTVIDNLSNCSGLHLLHAFFE
jgi:hypothetical protein